MRTTKLLIWMPCVLVLAALYILAGSAACAADVPRMSTDELKGLLGNPDVIVLDVRSGSDWDDSASMIAGALRESKEDFESWADKYPKDKTLVLYCS